MLVKTRPQTDVEPSIAFAGDLHTHGAAEGHHTVVDDTVVNLYTVAALAKHACLIEGVQVLRHVGLGSVDLGQQLAHILFANAQRADDAQAHGSRHDAKQIGGFFKNLFRFGQCVFFS